MTPAAILGSFLLILFVAEGLVRIFYPQQPIHLDFQKIMRPDNRVGDRNRENVDTIVNTGEGPVRFITNEKGFRVDQDQNNNQNPPAISILTLGDSFLLGLQVENRATIPEILKKRLGRHGIKPIRAVNTGVNGWNPNHYYMQARRSLAREKYDLGIVFLCIQNDCVGWISSTFRSRLGPRRHKLKVPKNFQWREWVDSLLYPLNDFFEARSHLFLFLKSRSRLLLARLGLTAYYFPEIFLQKNKESDRWKVTARICSNIHEAFHEQGIPVFFVLLPTKYQVYPDEFEAYVKMFKINEDEVDLELPNKMLRKAFESMSLPLIDPLVSMRQKGALGLKMYGSVDPHFNEKGHEMIALHILPTVENYLSHKLKK